MRKYVGNLKPLALIDMNIEIQMTADETLILSALSGCKGKAMAVTQHELAEACGMPARRVRSIIVDLIFNYHKRIGCCYSKHNGGYYMIQNDAEAKETTERLEGHALKILKRVAIIRKISKETLIKKLQMEFDL
jgi:hypothetical protein